MNRQRDIGLRTVRTDRDLDRNSLSWASSSGYDGVDLQQAQNRSRQSDLRRKRSHLRRRSSPSAAGSIGQGRQGCRDNQSRICGSGWSKRIGIVVSRAGQVEQNRIANVNRRRAVVEAVSRRGGAEVESGSLPRSRPVRSGNPGAVAAMVTVVVAGGLVPLVTDTCLLLPVVTS